MMCLFLSVPSEAYTTMSRSLFEITRDNILTRKLSGIDLSISKDYKRFVKATKFFTRIPNRDLYFPVISKEALSIIMEIDRILNSHLDDSDPSIARYYDLLRARQNVLKQIHQGCIDKNWNWINLL